MSLTLRSCNSAFVSRLNGSPPRCPLVLTHAPGSVDLTTRAVEFWSEGSYRFGLVVVGGPERFRYLEEGKFWFGFPLGLGVGWGLGVHFSCNPWTKATFPFKHPFGLCLDKSCSTGPAQRLSLRQATPICAIRAQLAQFFSSTRWAYSIRSIFGPSPTEPQLGSRVLAC